VAPDEFVSQISFRCDDVHEQPTLLRRGAVEASPGDTAQPSHMVSLSKSMLCRCAAHRLDRRRPSCWPQTVRPICKLGRQGKQTSIATTWNNRAGKPSAPSCRHSNSRAYTALMTMALALTRVNASQYRRGVPKLIGARMRLLTPCSYRPSLNST
jgi:hypothetical protein